MKRQIVKPTTLPGFMELLPEDQIIFNKMLNKIQNVYERYGFLPIDTPIIEKSEVLLAKGGGDTEKQIYRFNKGDSDLSLRFDLTVPLARYVSQHMSSLTFPFRRYQIGKVYRGERTQRGRFREFYQCDIDIIGNETLSIINDAEIPSVIYSIFTELDLDEFTIHINNRKILNGLFEYLDIDNKEEALRIIDKLDKIGSDNVSSELKDCDISQESIDKLLNFINIKGTNEEILCNLKALNIPNSTYLLGLEELSNITYYMKSFGIPEKNYTIDLKIARGLDYYTGTVFETILNNYPQIGSVCSGGRYDNLAEYYTKQKLPGVGISIGLTRLFYQLREAGIIKSLNSSLIDILVIPLDNSLEYCINLAKKFRQNNISTQVYLEDKKISKKLDYANKLNIPYVILVGSEEMESGLLTLKDMNSGKQFKLSYNEIICKYFS